MRSSLSKISYSAANHRVREEDEFIFEYERTPEEEEQEAEDLRSIHPDASMMPGMSAITKERLSRYDTMPSCGSMVVKG